MNNNRLSSEKTHKAVNRILLQKDIDRLLTEPSNFEVREQGRV
jgi:hypothetical protein